jgi:hypothetical protein
VPTLGPLHAGLGLGYGALKAIAVEVEAGAVANADTAAQQSAVQINVFKVVFILVITNCFLIVFLSGGTIPMAIHDGVVLVGSRERESDRPGKCFGGNGGIVWQMPRLRARLRPAGE